MGDMGFPASFTLDGQFGEEGFTAVMAGFSIYFGGEDKSLIRRHREDDPRLYNFFFFSDESEDGPAPCTGDLSLIGNDLE